MTAILVIDSPVECGALADPQAARSPGLVVARRWDGLGGRLTAIANGRSLAARLGLPFRFVWPAVDGEPSDPHQLFSKRFLDEFAIEPGELAGRRAMPHQQAFFESVVDRWGACEPDPSRFLEVHEVFSPVRVGGEAASAAAERFRAAFGSIEWSPQVERVLRLCAEWPGADVGLHVRAGDVVSGAWGACLVHEKHMPVPYVREGIRRFGTNRVLAVSDRPELLEVLRAEVGAAPYVRPDEVVDGYTTLPGAVRALADLVALSRCQRLFGPPRSAFTCLAAQIGHRRLQRIDELVEPGTEREVLLAELRAPLPPVRDAGALRARDVGWALDVFGATLHPLEALRLARYAGELDPGFAGIQARTARCAAMAGEFGLARSAALLAMRLAEPVHVYDDPLFGALASEAVVHCLGWADEAEVAPAPPGRLPDLVRLCASLRPFYASVPRVLGAINALDGLREQLSRASGAARRQAAQHLRRHALTDPRRAPKASVAALDRHRSADGYDALATEVERIGAAVRRAAELAGIILVDDRLTRQPW